MSDLIGRPAFPNLTELELPALESGINVADGHARYEPSVSQHKIIDRLPELFCQAAETPVSVLDREAQRAYLTAVGQHSALTGTEVLSCYSSSVAMEIFSLALMTCGVRKVALIHPTFDNIPDILTRAGMHLLPVAEDHLLDGTAGLPAGIEVLFVTTPNNPTGWILSRDALAHWARICASRGIILALDTSFRGFDERSCYDHFSVLAESGCRYVVIEDTGKLWPALDLKVGFLVFPPDEPLPLRRVYTEILLGVSPLVLLLVRCFAEDAGEGGFAELHQFIRSNRDLLRGRLAGAEIHSPDQASRISVERIAVPPGMSGTQVSSALRRRGVHVLPCGQFHWAEPEAGAQFVRVALSRPPGLLRAAADAILGCLRP
ncbi:MAG: aminotransferase class I/II-fold pyridoxal phosphate-dependent enzyme [Streptosporangiaceae bacterium]|nr:aminotransferase class I/II-fold pyridoxal phosphate-dependent enzyme [Streptosporangiaceae bacterium]